MFDFGQALDALACVVVLLVMTVVALFIISLTGWGWVTVERGVIGILLAIFAVSLVRRWLRSA